jgi:tetratricopeptide (TPR) repeat protein
VSRHRSDAAGARPRAAQPDLAAHALTAGLLALAALRLLAALAPGSALWGIDLGRWLPFGGGVLPWWIAMVALAPAPGRALAARMAAAAGVAGRRPIVTAVLVGGAAAVTVWALADRTQFLGDFALRTGTLAGGADLRRLFPQAMPLDVLVHVRLPDWLARAAHLEPATSQRLLGALCAALLALAALETARALQARGAAAPAVAAVVWAGGYLALFTGYGKGVAELTALSAMAAAAALRAVRDARALPQVALAVALAMGFHRAGILLLPLAIAVLAIAPGGMRSHDRTLAIGMLVAALAILGPRIVDLFVHFDVPHHLAAAEGARSSRGWLRACDLANAAILLAPLSPVIPALLPNLVRASRPERWLLAAMALPALAMFLVVKPQQGVFRDLDVFAPAAVMLSVVAACGVAGFLAGAPARSALAPGIALAALVPSALWLFTMHEPRVSLPRIAAFASGAPLRPAGERASIWDFLGTRALAERRASDAAAAYARAAEAAESPRFLYQWGTAELMRGDAPRADSLFRRSVARDPDFAPAWRGLASTASWAGDTLTCAAAERRLARLDPSAPELPPLRAFLERARAPGVRR